ncbi:VWD domain-containing protein [Nostoc sp. UHCC 0926]|uniref:VWD domain-containing protein n=1 Tax=unclassified Nostoc TaxID=2593658 RepID=UPI0023623BB6|nr:VWD domain-containing protein [Nostoc sp. UHCC 0926]WDD35079.1 VWD domain-containing protein [Nostoc sp. UHCC 0926]
MQWIKKLGKQLTLAVLISSSIVSASSVSAKESPLDPRVVPDNRVKSRGNGCGDVHMKTFDGRYYDLQASGEFIFVESKALKNYWVVQTRQTPWISNPSVSVNTAFATLVDGNKVVFDLDLGNRLQINGIDTTLASGQSVYVGKSIIERNNNLYTITYAGDNGIIDAADAQLNAWDNGDHINLEVLRFGTVKGLLGDNDGNQDNDLALRNGVGLPSNASFALINSDYADSWRVLSSESLFPPRIAISYAPPQFISVKELNPQLVKKAIKAATEAGIPEGQIFDNAVFDFAVTGGNINFIKGAAALFLPSTSTIR